MLKLYETGSLTYMIKLYIFKFFNYFNYLNLYPKEIKVGTIVIIKKLNKI